MAPRVVSLLWFALVLISVLAEPFPVQLDLKREAVSASQLARRASGSVSAPLIQQVLLQQLYWFNFSIGTPPQHFAVQLDTGSSDLWVPAADSKTCKNHPVLCAPTGAYRSNESSTYELLIPGEFFEAYKTPSSDKGDFVSDVVQFGGITLPNTTFGIAINQTGSAEASKNGILGMSYTVFQAADTRSYTYPTILDRLYTIGQIQRHAFSLYLNDRLNGAGSILFGGVDSEKYTGDLVALPIIMDDYYGNQTFVEYRVALTSIGINSDAGNYSALTSSNFTENALLDSGTTNMELPPTVVDAIFKGLGANEISSGGNTAYLVPCSYRNSNLSIAFQFGGASGPFINVTLADLLYEAGGLYSFGNGEEACVIEVVAAAAHNNDGYGYILGDSFLRSAYVVYDQDNNQIAMAQAKPNATASNIQMIPSGTGLPGVSSTATAAAPERTILSGTAGQASASATGVATGGTSSSSPTSSKVPTTLPMSAGSPTIALGVTGSGSAAASSSGSASGAASMHVAPMGSMTAILLVSVAASVLTVMLML